MERSQYHAARDRVLWHVVACKTNERFGPRTAWWFDNRRREPAGMVIFQVIESGRCVLRSAAGDSEVSAGQAFLFAYGEANSYGRPPDRPDWPGWSDDLRTAHISLGGAGLLEHWDVLRARFGPIVQLGRTQRILALLRDIERRCDRDPRADRRAVSPAVHGFVMTLFDEIEAAATLGLAPVERAVDDLLRMPVSGDPLKEVARRHGCTREHLTRVFAERIGMPPARWLRQARVQRAIELLRATDLPLATIAAQSGVASVRTLARLVRTTTGAAPGRLRHRTPRPPAD